MDFNENFLQLVWKYQYFDKNQLQTTDNQNLQIKKIGYHNFHEGPDFLEAQVHLPEVDYFGHIEVHRKSSDWKHHDHDLDPRYNSVILHVVWEDDKPIRRADGTLIPTFELKGRVFLDVVRNYERLIANQEEILCSQGLDKIKPIIRFSMLEKALVERLEEKSAILLAILHKTNNDWEETTYRWLFQCFGFKTNSPAMLRLAESVPYKILQKHGNQSLTLQAILLGQAGLIPSDPSDDFGKFLKEEYGFYQKKYLFNSKMSEQEWKMMGVRPSNFPSIRISQLAQILSRNPSLFSSITDDKQDYSSFKKLFSISTPDYWQHHHQLGKASARAMAKQLSPTVLSLLTINFVVPLWYAYGKYIQDSSWQEKCFDLLQQIAAEDNFIIRKYKRHDWKPMNAFDAQGMIGLYHHYCKPKKCLDCKIGQNLLKPDKK